MAYNEGQKNEVVESLLRALRIHKIPYTVNKHTVRVNRQNRDEAQACLERMKARSLDISHITLEAR